MVLIGCSGSAAPASAVTEDAGAAVVSTVQDGGSTEVSKWVIGGAELMASVGDAESTDTMDAPNAVAAVLADPAAKLFIQSCAGCHSFGKGSLSGPDLAPTAAWPTTDLRAAVERMQRQAGPMDDSQMDGLVELIRDPKVEERLAAEEQKSMKALIARMEKPSVEKGAKLFHGGLPFENGGVACSACHGIRGNGGNMGPDLTHTFSKMGEAALISASEQGNFKVMSAAYRDHKVTKQEAMHLTAYMKAVDENPPPVQATNVPLLGLAGTVLFLGGIGFLFRTRSSGSFRTRSARRR